MSATRQVLVGLALVLAACGSGAENTAAPAAAAEGDTLERVTENGPITARVAVTPEKPRLGDPITLTLGVTAAAGIVVEMPAFGEALGRFSIVSFTPRTQTNADGGTLNEQTYVLQAPMSGKQRLPALRIEYTDHRGLGAATAGDAGVAGEIEVKELLTDEIALEVESVLTDDELSGALRPARGPLEPARSLNPLVFALMIMGVCVLAIGAVVFVLIRGRTRDTRRQVDAYAEAMARLAGLEERGLPEGEDADAWYVELSGAVRLYIEDRYRIRAPELTTEEFLREARRVAALTDEHRALLSSFLADCDRVKFAGHRPASAESQDALETARRFVEETRLRQLPTGASSEEAPRAAA
ncbi:MAG TPA: hypothetical protein VML75_25445 [Kofleriaceae bacterium]|nr:hypothetical protein [Kofleriaceae bacterium]